MWYSSLSVPLLVGAVFCRIVAVGDHAERGVLCLTEMSYSELPKRPVRVCSVSISSKTISYVICFGMFVSN